MVGVELKYRKMRGRTDTYHPLVSLATLLGTIGGSIGLGMGLSLLTVVEFFMFLMDSLKVVILRRKIDKHSCTKDGDESVAEKCPAAMP